MGTKALGGGELNKQKTYLKTFSKNFEKFYQSKFVFVFPEDVKIDVYSIISENVGINVVLKNGNENLTYSEKQNQKSI